MPSRSGSRRGRQWRVLGWLVVSMLLAAAFAAPASASPTGAPGNNGTVKIHQSPGEAEPIVRNEPHVSCAFHLHAFFADAAQTGDWWIQSWPPTGDGTIVLTGSYTTDSNGEWRSNDETLPAGHYKLSWQDPPGANGKREEKHKVFWVDECAGATPTGQAGGATATPSGGVGGATSSPSGGVGGATASPSGGVGGATSSPSGGVGGATASPSGGVGGIVGSTPTPGAVGGVAGATGAPQATLPPTDTAATADGQPASNALRLILLALAGIVAAGLLLVPAPRRARRR